MKNKVFYILWLLIIIAILALLVNIFYRIYNKTPCIAIGIENNLDPDLTKKVCFECTWCDKIHPKDALKKIASGEAYFEDFLSGVQDRKYIAEVKPDVDSKISWDTIQTVVEIQRCNLTKKQNDCYTNCLKENSKSWKDLKGD